MSNALETREKDATPDTPAPAYHGITNSQENFEFGGPIGVGCLMVWSHYILFYFWYCLEKFNGQMIIPTSLDSLNFHITSFVDLLMTKGLPSTTVWLTYFAFFVVQIALAAFVPGITMYGMPTSTGERLVYHCNGYLCYYICIWGFFFVHIFGFLPGSTLADNFGGYLVASMVIADVTSVYWYIYGLYTTDPRNGTNTSSGSVIYDFFMGTVLYPRIGEVDIKMIAECRWSWLTLFLLTTSCALKQYEQSGSISLNMGVMLYAHWLYSNATVKGEHCIPVTWDMFHERYGWMLNFWNICGVPFLYCFQSFYILKNQKSLDETMNPYFVGGIYVLLTLAYYIFDSANCQKATCKQREEITRNTFPQVPWAVLKNPKFLKTPHGNLLIDGWYAYARKMQYTGDILMALSWGLACGFSSPLPYFYALFFTCMIIHRQSRDEIRCKEKYGEYWDIYTKAVPNVFVPSSAFFYWLFTGVKPHQD